MNPAQDNERSGASFVFGPSLNGFSQLAYKNKVGLTHWTEDKGEARRHNKMHMVAVTTPLEKTLIPKDMRREN
jgi:hypothetical protein